MPKFVAMWNLPGCLPEMEPQDFLTFDEAKQFIVDELQTQEDDLLVDALSTDEVTVADSQAVIAGRAVALAKAQIAPFVVNGPDGYVYSVDVTDWDYVEARIGDYFASYLINGDDSGINTSETRALDQFTAVIQEGRAGGHWDVGDSEEFARCEVTGLMGKCVNVRYNFKERT